MWQILQQKQPDDFVLATGDTHSVREFIEETFKHLNIKIGWSGKGEDEIGKDKETGKTIIEIDKKYFRPTEVELLIGDSTKAKKQFGWDPKVRFEKLVEIMIKADYDEVLKLNR
jgi:GDPmannose 4,6-dehydratase